jgi:hypothetical protein
MDITLFEIHLDGAQFGPATIGGEPAGDEGVDEEATVATGGDGSGGRSGSPPRFVPVVLAVAIAAGYVAYRRFRGGGAAVHGDEAPDVDAEAVEIEA